MALNIEQECKELKETIRRLEINIKSEDLSSHFNSLADCETIEHWINQIKEKIRVSLNIKKLAT